MKERPILFNGEMVRAILDGRKTQTRRIVKPQSAVLTDELARSLEVRPPEQKNMPVVKCPFGQPGDRLWVRESFAIVPRTAYAHSTGIEQVLRPHDNHGAAVFREGWERSKPGRWRPSIHMPRWASRITLEIISVRIERLNHISHNDARSEGVYQEHHEWLRSEYFLPDVAYRSKADADYRYSCPRDAFQELWETINGADSWNANPWVWVVEFKRPEAPEVE